MMMFLAIFFSLASSKSTYPQHPTCKYPVFSKQRYNKAVFHSDNIWGFVDYGESCHTSGFRYDFSGSFENVEEYPFGYNVDICSSYGAANSNLFCNFVVEEITMADGSKTVGTKCQCGKYMGLGAPAVTKSALAPHFSTAINVNDCYNKKSYFNSRKGRANLECKTKETTSYGSNNYGKNPFVECHLGIYFGGAHDNSRRLSKLVGIQQDPLSNYRLICSWKKEDKNWKGEDKHWKKENKQSFLLECVDDKGLVVAKFSAKVDNWCTVRKLESHIAFTGDSTISCGEDWHEEKEVNFGVEVLRWIPILNGERCEYAGKVQGQFTPHYDLRAPNQPSSSSLSSSIDEFAEDD